MSKEDKAPERFLRVSETAVSATDDRGPGNANHKYIICKGTDNVAFANIKFQKGPIREVGINGVQNEDLLMIVIDRLIGFQVGEYACEENEEALRLLVEAASVLQLRTAKRRARDVEGKSIK